MHAQYFGTLDDYGRALTAAERLVRLYATSPEAYLQRASARQSLHEFAGALADLGRAQQLGGDGDTIAFARAGIMQALGRYDEALAIRRHLARAHSTTSLALLGQLEAEMGHVAAAEADFVAAEVAFADVSPFPLAWLYFQAGLVEERAGRPAAARGLYEAAHLRLPQYAPAAGHLAALVAAAGDRTRAVALVEPLVRDSDDPEYEAQLAMLIAPRDPARAQVLVAAAGRRYQALEARWPAAFADHAARFWLGAGHDAPRALGLARRNLATRPTADAYDLMIEAALAAHASAVACAAADEAARLPYATAALHLHASQAFAACGRGARATAELARITPAH
jgi:hypothetical protein